MRLQLNVLMNVSRLAGIVGVTFFECSAAYPTLLPADHLTGEIRRLLPNGEVSDDASAALRRIRANIVQTRDHVVLHAEYGDLLVKLYSSGFTDRRSSASRFSSS